ncbi:MAG: fibronectin type III domain-containing protein, partial [Chloroflexi bacterium]|nr:fibronectin type III domain-containing protein [Chloroflexota bacterium]
AGSWWTLPAADAQGGLPGAPDIHTITPLHQGLRVYWWPPGRDGGSALTGYDVHYRASGVQTWTDAGHTGLSQPAVISGLRTNATYEVRVRARNANGAGAWSILDSRRTARDDGRPDPPLPPALTPGDGEIAVSWHAPSHTGARPITGYRVRYTSDDGDTWRTWSSGGSSLITGTSATITGLDNGVLTGVIVAAENSRGRSTWSAHTAEAVPVGPLSLTLESSRDLCTANTLTELSWTITGGVPPYTLTIDGAKVDANAESHRVDCGPLAVDPSTRKPLPGQAQVFQAVASDARGRSTSVSSRVKLAEPLPAPQNLYYRSYVDYVLVFWDEVEGAGAESPHRPIPGNPGEYEATTALLRTRLADEDSWTYSALGRLGKTGAALEPPPGVHRLQVSAVRHPLELETPEVLSWSEEVVFAATMQAQNVKIGTTHDTVTVSWDRQPYASGQEITVILNDRSRLRALHTWEEPERSGRHEVTFTHVPPDREYQLTIMMVDTEARSAPPEYRLQTLSAPAGWIAPPRGAQNLRAAFSGNQLKILWDPPYEDAAPTFNLLIENADTGQLLHSQGAHGITEWDIPLTRFLRSATRYRIIVEHHDFLPTDADIVVERSDSSRSQRSTTNAVLVDCEATTPLCFFPVWPVSVGSAYAMTDDPFQWRAVYENPKFHAGLDIGEYVRQDVNSPVRGDPIYAVADGTMRVFDDNLATPAWSAHSVMYCPQNRPLHEQLHLVAGTPGTRWWNGTNFHSSPKQPEDIAFCQHLATPNSGRTAIIAHTLPDGTWLLTKYAHLDLDGFPREIARALAINFDTCDPALALRERCRLDPEKHVSVRQGQQIGRLGSSGNGEEDAGWDAHLHFEIRHMNVPASLWNASQRLWYSPTSLTLRTCRGRYEVGADCKWNGGTPRYMDTVLDAEAYLPPLPASFTPQDATYSPDYGDTPIEDANEDRQAIEVLTSMVNRTYKPKELTVRLRAAVWRPEFYTRYVGQTSRTRNQGIYGTGPGVDSYHTNASCSLLPDDLLHDPIISALPDLPDLPDLPTIDVRTGMAILSGDPSDMMPAGELPREGRVLRLSLDGPCKSGKVTVRASNAHWERQHPDQILDRADQNIELRDPSALIAWAADLESSVDEQTLPGQQLAGNAINLYTFVGHRGHTYQFCTIPPAPKAPVPGVCTDETSAANTAELLLVGPSGSIPDGIASANGLSWTVPTGAPPAATYTLVVRRRDRESQANPSPINYKYALRYTVPLVNKCGSLSGISGQGGAVVGAVAATSVCKPPRPTNVRVTSQTDDSLTVAWDGVDGGTKYELKAITTIDCEADQTPDDQFKSTTDTTYPYVGLEADTDYTLCVRAERVIGSAGTALTIWSAWASGNGRTLAVDRLPQPTNLRVVERTSSNLTVRWDESSGAQSYQLRMDEDDATIASANNFAGPRTHRLTGLSPARAYKVQVQSVQGARTSEWTPPITFYTLLPTPVIDANQVSATTQTATFGWGEVTGADGYVVRRVPDGRTAPLKDVRSHQFGGLDPNEEYELSVRATLMGNSEVTSAWASTPVTTQQAVLSVSIAERVIAGDGWVNAQERADGFPISGKATAGANVSVTVAGTGVFSATADSLSAWSLRVPGNRAYITAGRLTVTAQASMSGFRSASAAGAFNVDLTDPSVSYTLPISLRIGTAVSLSPTTSDTDIAAYALVAGEALPAGLSLNPSSGLINGAPTTAGSASTTALLVSDRAGNRTRVSLSWPSVNKIPQILRGFAYTPSSIRFGDAAPSLTPPSGAVGALSYRSQTTAVCAVGSASGALSILAEGTCTVIATAAATATHLAGTARATVAIGSSCTRPASSQTVNVSETRWVGTGAVQDEEERSGAQRQTRSVNWNDVTCTGTRGTWRNAGEPVWGNWQRTGRQRCNPDYPTKPPEKKTETVTKTQWVQQGTTAIEQSRTDTEHFSRTVERQTVAEECGWDPGGWGSPDNIDEGTFAPTGTRTERPEAEQKQNLGAGTQTRWDVGSDRACQEVEQREQRRTRTVAFSSTTGWDTGNWGRWGNPYRSGWSPNGVCLDKPRDDVVPRRTGVTTERRWVTPSVPDGVICSVEQSRQRYRLAYHRRPHVWGGSNWVDGLLNRSPFFTEPTIRYTTWQPTGKLRPCPQFAREAGVSGQSETRTAQLSAGVYGLDWGDQWLSFTVPEGATVRLSGRIESGAEAVVFSTAAGAALVVTSQAPNVAKGLPTPNDPTLAALAASLRLAEPAAVDPPADSEPECAAAAQPANGAVKVELDADLCMIVHGGGKVDVSFGAATRSLILPADRDWMLTATTGADQTLAIAIVDLATGGYLIIKAVDGSELSRNLGTGGAALGPLFDGMLPKASGDGT